MVLAVRALALAVPVDLVGPVLVLADPVGLTVAALDLGRAVRVDLDSDRMVLVDLDLADPVVVVSADLRSPEQFSPSPFSSSSI